MDEEYYSFNITIDKLFLLAPIEKIQELLIMKIFLVFFIYNDIQAYFILIDKRSSNLSNSSQTFIRYTFSGLLENYEIGQLILSTKNSFYQSNEKVDLSYIQLDINEGYLFELDNLNSNYIDSLHWWKERSYVSNYCIILSRFK